VLPHHITRTVYHLVEVRVRICNIKTADCKPDSKKCNLFHHTSYYSLLTVCHWSSLLSVCHWSSLLSVCHWSSLLSVCHWSSLLSVCHWSSLLSVCHWSSLLSVCHWSSTVQFFLKKNNKFQNAQSDPKISWRGRSFLETVQNITKLLAFSLTLTLSSLTI
jgi:hypothetical protein